MATKHWARDVLLTDNQNYIANGNHLKANALLYHFLRNAGFDWLWECGNTNHAVDPNYVPDGNMELAGVTNWSATGAATMAKVTTPVDSGSQALEVTPGAGGGVQSADLGLGSSVISITGATGCSLTGPDANGLMTYTHIGNTGVGSGAAGQEFTMSGSVQSANNGRFPIVAWPEQTNGTQLRFYNPNGVAEVYTTNPPDPATYNVSISVRVVFTVTMVVSNSGSTLNVDIDRGDGSPVTVGTIPNNGGVYTRYTFQFAVQGSGPYYVYVGNPSSGPPFYIDSMSAWRSSFEYYMARDEAVASPDPAHYAFTNNLAPNHYGVDGVLTNPDQFSTGAGDNYSPSADDIGKHLFIWDDDPGVGRNKNSGIYEIIADVGGGVVQVDMRSGSAAFINATGLRWRIVDIQQFDTASGGAGTFPNANMPSWQQSAGFGIESPHVTGWRFFMRQNQASGQVVKSSEMWSAPENTDFDQSTGFFSTSGPSVQRNRAGQWSRNVSGGGTNPAMHTWRGTYTYTTSPTVTRTFIMVDEDLSFFSFVHWDDRHPSSTSHATFFVGYHDPDPYHPGIMAFMHLSMWEELSTNNNIFFDGQAYRFAWQGTSFDHNDLSVRCCAAQLGYGTNASTPHEQSNAGPNPWSSEEWLQELRIVNDPDVVSGVPSERDAGPDIGVYQGRINLSDLATFDSDNYLHFDNGLVWEWSGESLVP